MLSKQDRHQSFLLMKGKIVINNSLVNLNKLIWFLKLTYTKWNYHKYAGKTNRHQPLKLGRSDIMTQHLSTRRFWNQCYTQIREGFNNFLAIGSCVETIIRHLSTHKCVERQHYFLVTYIMPVASLKWKHLGRLMLQVIKAHFFITAFKAFRVDKCNLAISDSNYLNNNSLGSFLLINASSS